MTKARDTYNSINTLTGNFIEYGLVDNYNFPFIKMGINKSTEISYKSSGNSSISLRSVEYSEMYEELKNSRDYSFSMLDGALIQMQYIFDNLDQVSKHRLAFFPSPNLIEYQNDPEIYDDDIVYAEILDKGVMASPIRFDFDVASGVPDVHSTAHVTLGQYRNCRIPMTGALSPQRFIEFILKSFYNTAFLSISEDIKDTNILHLPSITESECKGIHFGFECARPC